MADDDFDLSDYEFLNAEFVFDLMKTKVDFPPDESPGDDISDDDDSSDDVTRLDSLPPELLTKVASFLDCKSLICLERVSRRCRDAVALSYGTQRCLDFSEDLFGEWGCRRVARLLPFLTGLRELRLNLRSFTILSGFRLDMSKTIELIADACRGWSSLEKLVVTIPSQASLASLEQLLANCSQLTHLSMMDVPIESWQGALGTLQKLRSLHVHGRPHSSRASARRNVRERGMPGSHTEEENRGEVSLISQLPVELHHLKIGAHRWGKSEAVTRLARLGALTHLMLSCVGLKPEDLAAGLGGCASLKQLTLFKPNSVVSSLPLSGLPALRSLSLGLCSVDDDELSRLARLQPDLVCLRLCSCSRLTPGGLLSLAHLPAMRHLIMTQTCQHLSDADFARLVERLPALESLSLGGLRRLTPRGLAVLVQLPALASLNLSDMTAVTDWSLALLSVAPLLELHLDIWRHAGRVTKRGLIRFALACPSLKKIVIWTKDVCDWMPRIKGTMLVRCGTRFQKQELPANARQFTGVDNLGDTWVDSAVCCVGSTCPACQ